VVPDLAGGASAYPATLVDMPMLIDIKINNKQ